MDIKKLIILLAAVAFFASASLMAQPKPIDYSPSATYMFAQRDTCDLFMDVYEPSPGSETTFEGKEKPTILWLFGGGFIGGERSSPRYLSWFKLMNDNGYRIITSDYRPALKGKKMGFGLFQLIPTAKNTIEACFEVGVQDCFSAVVYIIENKDALGVDPDNIVLAGSSAGAMIAVTAEWELVNRMPNAEVLPEGWNFAGVMSFAGAIMSNQGKPKWNKEPCQQLLFHGTEDGTVFYKKLQLGKLGIFGSSALADGLKKQNYPYVIVRLAGHQHDIAESMLYLWPWEKRWLETNIIQGHKRIVDEWTFDPSLPSWGSATLDSLY